MPDKIVYKPRGKSGGRGVRRVEVIETPEGSREVVVGVGDHTKAQMDDDIVLTGPTPERTSLQLFDELVKRGYINPEKLRIGLQGKGHSLRKEGSEDEAKLARYGANVLGTLIKHMWEDTLDASLKKVDDFKVRVEGPKKSRYKTEILLDPGHPTARFIDDRLRFYGGTLTGIGGNCIQYSQGKGKARVLWDNGINFNRVNEFCKFAGQSPHNIRGMQMVGLIPPLDGYYRHVWDRDDRVEYIDDTNPGISLMIGSHAHVDHVGGAFMLGKTSIPILVGPTTKEIMFARDDTSADKLESYLKEHREFNTFVTVHSGDKVVVDDDGRVSVIHRLKDKKAKGRVVEQKIYGLAEEEEDRKKKRVKTHLNTVMIYNIGEEDEITEKEKNSFEVNCEGKTVNLEGTLYEPVHVDQSVPGAYAYIITPKDGPTIVYSGDVRMHGFDKDYTEDFLRILRERHIDILIAEGTNIGAEGSVHKKKKLKSEEDVKKEMTETIKKADGLVIVDSSPVDFDRVRTICQAAKEDNRTVIQDLKRAYIMLNLNQDPEEEEVRDLPQVGDGPGQFLILADYMKGQLTSEEKEEFGEAAIKEGRIKGRTGGKKDLLTDPRYFPYIVWGSLTEEDKEELKTEFLLAQVERRITSRKDYKGFRSRLNSSSSEEERKTIRSELNGYIIHEVEKENQERKEGKRGGEVKGIDAIRDALKCRIRTRDEILGNPEKYVIADYNAGPTIQTLLEEADKALGGTFILSRSWAFNEQMMHDQERLFNWVKLAGMKIKYTHASGHYYEKGLKEMVEAASTQNPSPVIIGIHGENIRRFRHIVSSISPTIKVYEPEPAGQRIPKT